MNLKEAGAVMDVLTVSYPQFYRNQGDEDKYMAAKLWAEMFADDQLELVLAAVKAFIAADDAGFPPTVGKIKASIVKLTKPPELDMSEMEAWTIVRRAIHGSYLEEWSRKMRPDGSYTLASAEVNFEKLPPLLQQIVGGPENLAEWNKLDDKQLNTVLQSNFMRSFRARVASTKEFLALPADIRQTMARLGSGMKMALTEGSGEQ